MQFPNFYPSCYLRTHHGFNGGYENTLAAIELSLWPTLHLNMIKPATTLVLTFSINHQSSNAFISTNKQAMNANHRCKSKRNSLAFQWDQNRYDRSYELGDIPDLVELCQ